MQFLSRLKLYNTNVSSIISIKPSSCYHFNEITNLFHDALFAEKGNNVKIETLFSSCSCSRAVVKASLKRHFVISLDSWNVKLAYVTQSSVVVWKKNLFPFSIFHFLSLSTELSSSVSIESLDVSVQWKFSSRGEKEK